MIVQDQIVKNPKYMLIGEAPGFDEDRLGKPFQGKAGAQLNRLLNAVGIDRESECYVTNVTQKRPDKNNFGVYYRDANRNTPTGQLTDLWKAVRHKVRKVKPRVAIVLGNEALRACTGKRGIASWRGSILECEGVPVVVALPPAYLLRQAYGEGAWLNAATVADFARAERVANGERANETRYTLVTEARKLHAFFGTHDNTAIAFDIETNMTSGRVKCVQFCAEKGRAIVVPFPEHGLAQAHLECQQAIKEWATCGKIQWIGQNAYNFDIPHIWRQWGWRWDALWVDTMVLHGMLHAEMPHDLQTIASLHSTVSYYKNTSGENLYLYGAKDVDATLQSALAMIEDAKKRNLWSLYETYYRPLLVQLSTLSMRGMRIDKEYQKKLRSELNAEIKVKQRDMDEVYVKHAGFPNFELRLQRLQMLEWSGRKTTKFKRERNAKGKFKKHRIKSLITALEKEVTKKENLNVRSTKDLAYFLYTVLGLPKKTKKGKLTTDKSTLNQLYLKTGHEFLRNMIELRHVKNMLSRWGKLKTDEKDLISTTYSFAETGRLRSGKFEAK